ncbi:MAG: lactate utilization protein [Pleurocapsa minor GSE-CHR-MK-17-07R]|jgi:L-lactate dehydrogenase complex protein LldG|nr:lactate utilization protein [Pleurocapsa minor GSE-CHR-MK 17-07R]
MSTTARDAILNKLRAAQRPFENAPPRPRMYIPVANDLEDTSQDALVARFAAEMTNLKGEPQLVTGDDAAREAVISALKAIGTTSILAWDFQHIPVAGLREAIAEAGIDILYPDTTDEYRTQMLATAEAAGASVTGVTAAVAATGTMIVRTGAGRGRIATVLAPVHIAVIEAGQIVARLENWVAAQRANGLSDVLDSANVCFISGPSRTGDIEMELILGVHGPGRVIAIIKQ